MKMAIAALAVFILAGCASVDEFRPSGWPTLNGEAPLVIAHRGASGYLPEHTLEAYALAIDQGADVVEPDLVFTKDNVLVARHDRYLSTTTDVADRPEFAARKRANDDPADAPREDWWVEDFTLAELKTLRARQPFPGRSKEFDGLYAVPTFAEILALVARKAKEAGRPVGVYPETKHPAFYASIGKNFEAPLLAALKGFDAGPVFIQSFEADILKRLKGRTTAKLVQLVTATGAGAPNIPLAEIATYADGVGPAKELILTNEGRVTGFIKESHALGLAVHPWTFRNDVSRAEAFQKKSERSAQAMNTIDERFTVVRVELEQDWTRFGIGQDTGRELYEYIMWGADGVFADFPDTAVKVRAENPYARRAALTAPPR